MDLTTFTTTALLAFALWQAQNLLRYLKAIGTTDGRNGALGIVLAFVIGLGIAEWAAHASITTHLVLVTDAPEIGKMDFGSLALLGVGLGSAGGAFADWLKSRDNTQTNAKPKLVGPDDLPKAA